MADAYFPCLEDVKKLSCQGNLIPVYRKIQADLETPVSAYLKVARPPYSFLFESVEGGERIGRFSFIGTEPYSVCSTGPGTNLGSIDPLIQIEKELNKYKLVPVPGLPPFDGGAVGYLSYDVVHYFEPRVPQPDSNPIGVPESLFMFMDSLLIFDHLEHNIKVVTHVLVDDDIETSYNRAINKIDELVERLSHPVPHKETKHDKCYDRPEQKEISSNFSKNAYMAMVNRIKDYIYAGDVIQTVPSQRLIRPTSASPFEIYRTLRTVNPSPYMYYLNLDNFQIVGASPEMLLQIQDGRIATHPIAGTRPRGKTHEDDLVLEKELIDNEKERAEHIMLVDLARNDIGRVSQTGSVHVPRLMGVDRYSHVMHLVSRVEGLLRPDYTIYDAMRACFPAGTLSGAPKIRAMEIISDVEQEQRGPYSGAVGYFSYAGNTDTALTIRTLVYKDGIAYIQAGGGIVFDSVPLAEYEETLHKAGALLKAINTAEAQGI